jgi:hypothetical protein
VGKINKSPLAVGRGGRLFVLLPRAAGELNPPLNVGYVACVHCNAYSRASGTPHWQNNILLVYSPVELFVRCQYYIYRIVILFPVSGATYCRFPLPVCFVKMRNH